MGQTRNEPSLAIEVRDFRTDVRTCYELPGRYAVLGSGREAGIDLPELDGESPRFYLQAVRRDIAAVGLSGQGTRPAQPRLIRDGTRLRVGDVGVAVLLRGRKALPETRPAVVGSRHQLANRDMPVPIPNGRACDARLGLINCHSRTEQAKYRGLRESITLIGSSKRCHVKLRGGGIAAFHYSVVRDGDHWRLVGLLGRGKLRLNGRRAVDEQLRVGDVISVGPVELRLERPEPEIVSEGGGSHVERICGGGSRGGGSRIEEICRQLNDVRGLLREQTHYQEVQTALLMQLLKNGVSSTDGVDARTLRHLEQLTGEIKGCRADLARLTSASADGGAPNLVSQPAISRPAVAQPQVSLEGQKPRTRMSPRGCWWLP